MYQSKRNSRKEALSKGYRSNFEYAIAKWLTLKGIPFKYESEKLPYLVPETKRTYTPDWQFNDDEGYIYESKGRFSSIDRKKMLLVQKTHPEKVIRMIFQNSTIRLSKTSKTTYADWCDNNNIEWCDFRKGIPKAWLK